MSRDTNSSEAETCPVDAATRAAWLKSNSQGKTPFSPPNPPESPLTSASCDSSTIDQRLPQSTHPSNSEPASSTTYFSRFKSLLWASPSPLPSQSTKSDSSLLSTARVISSIPRTETKIAGNEGQAANNEIESGTSSTGKWIYPSEKMFFEAMKRKGYSSDERDMKTIVPIHNAVNERAWKEIRLWEVPFCDDCPLGPQLSAFQGLGTTTPSPRARLNSFLGYTTPFDRHDWVVDRCGKRVDYIIDFYQGKGNGKGPEMLSFYLDVRPKLNTWEGVKMRVVRFFSQG